MNNSATNLMAIYKLEFYKRKNNWKLDKGTKKLPQPLSSEITSQLNKTYDVDEEMQLDGQQVSPHNKAFLNEEPEDTPDPQPPDDALPSTAPEHGPLRPHSWSGQLYNGVRSEPLWQDAQQDWYGTEPELIVEELPDELAYDQRDGVWHQRHLWASAPDLSVKPAVDPLDRVANNLTNEEMLSEAEDWLFRHGYPLLQEYPCSYDGHGLTEEGEDFVRGAHEAPHSSELELNITQECPCTAQNRLYALTVRQLARAIQRHHYALARLLWERANRDGLSAGTRPHTLFSFEECPTRDTDTLWAPDGILAGSHHSVSGSFSGVSGPFSAQPLQATGRGRGRLQQARQLVGVAMGRPYLL